MATAGGRLHRRRVHSKLQIAKVPCTLPFHNPIHNLRGRTQRSKLFLASKRLCSHEESALLPEWPWISADLPVLLVALTHVHDASKQLHPSHLLRSFKSAELLFVHCASAAMTSENHVKHVSSPMSKPRFLKEKVIHVSFLNANDFNSSMRHATTSTFPRSRCKLLV